MLEEQTKKIDERLADISKGHLDIYSDLDDSMKELTENPSDIELRFSYLIPCQHLSKRIQASYNSIAALHKLSMNLNLSANEVFKKKLIVFSSDE